MLEKIFDFAIYLLGVITFSIILVFTVTNIVEKIQIKIKQGKDPETNIKHINRLIRKIERQGWKVDVRKCNIQGNPDIIPTKMSVSEVRLSKTRRTKLGVEVDEENNVVN